MPTPFPKPEGWITAKLSLKCSALDFSDDDARNFLTFGKPDRIELGEITRSGRRMVVIYREIKPRPRRSQLTNHGAPIQL